MSTTPAVPLYARLPEVYRTYDAEQSPPYPLRAWLAAVEAGFGALHADIGQFYEDLFIDTCDDWVIPYLADLLGTSHLKGDARTLRADVLDTIALRRRKGTLGAIARLAANLTGWPCRAVELRVNLGWTQHLNHGRPDAGGAPPLADPARTRFHLPRGGTAPLRDPAALSLLGTPFDRFAYSADIKPPGADAIRFNLPNLAVFLWRLHAWRLARVLPLAKGLSDLGAQPAGLARFALRFDLHPLDLPVRLFNVAGAGTPLIDADAVPGPIQPARLDSGTPDGNPEAYAGIDFYDALATPPAGFDLGDTGLQLYFPQTLRPLLGADPAWTWRGANLCAWEDGLAPPLRSLEIAVDPSIGRVLVGLDTADQAAELVETTPDGPRSRAFAALTYASPGPVGAHPATRGAAAVDASVIVRRVGAVAGGMTLQAALAGLESVTGPVLVEIHDSLVHPFDLSLVPGSAVDGTLSLRLADGLTIRATGGHRPIVLLAQPLSLRVRDAAAATPFFPTVRLEGLYLAPAPGFPAGAALVGRAAVARLELHGCTLAPGGHSLRDGTRAPMQAGLRLADGYGFTDPADLAAFVPTPDIVLQRSVSGALAIDARYALSVESSIVDAGSRTALAIGAASAPAGWAAALHVDGLTCFGRVRTAAAAGLGAIFTGRLEVLDNGHGCIKWSAFSGDMDRLPPNHFCVSAPDARIVFVSERFNDPGYGGLARGSDRRVREGGPGDDAMGAWGFLFEAHKWADLQVRLREFMPVGVRPLVLPVT